MQSVEETVTASPGFRKKKKKNTEGWFVFESLVESPVNRGLENLVAFSLW